MQGEVSLLDVGRVLGVDNFYTDVHLFFHLGLRKTDSIGTVRKNRTGFPKSLITKKYSNGEKGARVVKYCD
jgi:hypothetical protein